MRGFVAERVRITSLLLAVLIAWPAASPAQKSKAKSGSKAAEKARGRAGERVVLKPWVEALKSGDHTIKIKAFQIYRIRLEKGAKLLLAPEDIGLIGWADEDDVVPLDKAVDFFSAEIERQPSARNYTQRANLRSKLGDYENALRDSEEVIRLDPRDHIIYSIRGVIYNYLGKYDEGIAAFDESIRMQPAAITYANRAFLRVEMKEYEKALEDFTAAIHRDKTEPIGFVGRAWLRATCPVAKYRDGRRAVDGAKVGCELTEWKSAYCLNVLAEAYAESGDFKSAVKWEKKALEHEPKDGSRRADMEKRLALFQAGKPYRREPRPATKLASESSNPASGPKKPADSK